MAAAATPVQIRQLPKGLSASAVLVGVQGSVLMLELPISLQKWTIDQPVEINSEDAIYLGVVEQLQAGGLSVQVEHYLDRKVLASLQNTWHGHSWGGEGQSRDERA